MTKQKQLVKALTRRGIICGCVVAAFTGLYFLTDSMSSGMIPKKDEADKALRKDEGEISRLKTQLEKAGVAEANFAALMKERQSTDFSSSSDTMKEWLRTAKTRYRLSNDFKLNLTPDRPVANKDLAENFDVAEHPGMKLEFDAMSDTHIYAFIDDMIKNAPGMIRVDSVAIKRSTDFTPNILTQMRAGNTPYMMDTQIEFNWIGITEKPAKEPAAAGKGAEAGKKK